MHSHHCQFIILPPVEGILLNTTFPVILKLFTNSAAIGLSNKQIKVFPREQKVLFQHLKTAIDEAKYRELAAHQVQTPCLCYARLNAKLPSPEIGYQSK